MGPVIAHTGHWPLAVFPARYGSAVVILSGIGEAVVNVNVGDCEQVGETALMKAAYSGHEDAVRLLLSKGADIKMRGTVRTITIAFRVCVFLLL